jgi:hypothetical protein
MQTSNANIFGTPEDYDDLVEHVPTPDPATVEPVAPPRPTARLSQPSDITNRLTHVPPAIVDMVREDPEKLRQVARSMAAMNLHNLFQRVQNRDTSTKDRLEFQTLLNKMSGLDVKENAASTGAGFSINIVLPGHKDKTVTVESTAQQVDDE